MPPPLGSGSSFAVARDYCHRRFALLPQDLTKQEQVGEQGSKVDGSVQIVDQLGLSLIHIS